MGSENILIGVCGEINSGKDEVGKIIQYFLSGYNKRCSYFDFVKEYTTLHKLGEIKKFADKLKDIVCILLGCTRAQLEDRTFKETVLGEQWVIYDETAIKNWLLDCKTREEIDNMSSEDFMEFAKLHFGLHPEKHTFYTPRKLLQILGTEGGRNLIHPNIWINATFSDYKPLRKEHFYTGNYSNNCHVCGISFIGDKRQSYCRDCVDKYNEIDRYPAWIITDVRFPNEANSITNRGGFVIKLNRGCNTKSETSSHESETSISQVKGKYIIDNNGTIDELVSKVEEILILEGLINE